MPRADRVKIDDILIQYFDWEGEGPPLVLLHGGGGNARWWDPLARFLKPSFHVYAPDMRGHGDSDKPPSGYSTAEVAEDILGFVHALNLQRPSLVGHSYTGKALIQHAALHPQEVDGLILVDPTPPEAADPPPELVEAMLAPLLAELGPFPSLEAALGTVRQLPQYRNWNDDLERAFHHGIAQAPDGTVTAKMPPWVVREVALGALRSDVSDLLPRVVAPTLLITSSEMEQLLGHGAPLSRALPRCTWVVLEANHWVYTDNPQAFHRVVEEFLGNR